MKYAVVYSSRTGNTKMLAEVVKAELKEEDCVYFGTPDDKALEADRIYAGFWTDKGKCDEATEEFLKKLEKQEVFLFGTAGFGENDAYFHKILSRTEKSIPKTATVKGGFMCQGKMPMAVRERYEKMLESPVHAPNLKGMIENFDKALSHPDAKDLDDLKQAVAKAE